MPCRSVDAITYCLPDAFGSPASSAFIEIERLTSFSLNTSRAALARSSVSALIVTPSSPDHSIDAFVPRKSKRCEISLAAWLSALSTSCRSTLLTMSKDESAMARPYARPRNSGLCGSDDSARHAAEHAGLVGTALVVQDHAEPVGGVDHGDHGDQRGDLVVVVVLAYLSPGLVRYAGVGVREPGALL